MPLFRAFVPPLCERLCAEMGFEYVDAELVKEGPGRYLRIYIDKTGGVTLDDCEAFHRAVQPRLEPVDYDFLEISSPGLDRPLKTERDYARALGARVEVRLFKPLDGLKRYEGALAGLREGAVVLTADDGTERSFDLRLVALVKPVIQFDEGEDNA